MRMTKSEKEAFMRDGNDNESCSRRGKSRAHLRRTEREKGPFITHHVHMEQPSDIHNKAPPKSELRVSGASLLSTGELQYALKAIMQRTGYMTTYCMTIYWI